MDLSKKICPYCGKKLELIPPSREYLTQTMSISMNGMEFHVANTHRIKSYTVQPNADKEYKPEPIVAYLENSMVYMRCDDIFVDHVRKSVPSGLTPMLYVRRQLKKGRTALFRRAMLFQCKKCMNIVTFNDNPYRLNIGAIGLAWLITMMLLVIAAMLTMSEILLVPPLMLLLVPIPALIVTVIFSVRIALTFIKIRYTNNIVPVEETDDLIKMPKLFTADLHIPEKYRKEANIFSTMLNSRTYQLYLTRVHNGTAEFYICGVDGEQEKMLAELSQHRNITLPLSFEDVPIGDATVLNVYEIPEELIIPEEERNQAPTEWRCNKCGYINHTANAQCRSCGEYK